MDTSMTNRLSNSSYTEFMGVELNKKARRRTTK